MTAPAEGPQPHKHDYSVYIKCLECRLFGISTPEETTCGNCGGIATVLYSPPCCIRAAFAAGEKKGGREMVLKMLATFANLFTPDQNLELHSIFEKKFARWRFEINKAVAEDDR